MNDLAHPIAAEPALLTSRTGAVATLTLARPRQYNALSSELLDSLAGALENIAGDRSVRVVVLAAAGPAFCAGHDLRQLREIGNRAGIAAVFRRCSEVMLAIAHLPQPVIARVHGLATAAGCQLVAQCDLAVAAQEARFATSGINVGLFCATPAVPLSRGVPRKRAMEMLLTGDFVDAQAALAMGLVNRVVAAEELDATVAALAAKIAAKPPEAIALGKRLFHRQLEAGLEDAYAMAADAMATNFMQADTLEGVAAFVEKRPPNWRA